jgi:hypothetical protein
MTIVKSTDQPSGWAYRCTRPVDQEAKEAVDKTAT